MHSDWIDLFELFEKNGVRSLIIGGMAVAYHGHERFTKDVDIWVSPDPENAGRVFASIKEFGAPVARLKASDFEDRDGFVVIGAEPFRVDILMGPPGVEFDDAWRKRIETKIGNVAVNYISRDDLIALKRAAGRPVDKRDIEALKASAPKAKRPAPKTKAKAKSKPKKKTAKKK